MPRLPVLGLSFSAAAGTGSVINGQVSGNQVSLDIGSENFHHAGTVSGSTMAATTTWTFDEGSAGTPGALNGTGQPRNNDMIRR